MKVRVLQAFERRANWRGFLLSAVVTLLLTLLVSHAVGPQDGTAAQTPPFDTRVWYTPEEVYGDLALYTSAQRRSAVVGHLTADLLYPLAYGTFFTLSLIGLYRPRLSTSRWRWLPLLPWLSVLADYSENVALSVLFLAYPTRLPGLVVAAAICTAAKWSIVGLTALALTGGVIFRALSALKGNRD